jgi:hypothetical protein
MPFALHLFFVFIFVGQTASHLPCGRAIKIHNKIALIGAKAMPFALHLFFIFIFALRLPCGRAIKIHNKPIIFLKKPFIFAKKK